MQSFLYLVQETGIPIYLYTNSTELQEGNLSKSNFLIFIKFKNCREKKSQVSKYK